MLTINFAPPRTEPDIARVCEAAFGGFRPSSFFWKVDEPFSLGAPGESGRGPVRIDRPRGGRARPAPPAVMRHASSNTRPKTLCLKGSCSI